MNARELFEFILIVAGPIASPASAQPFSVGAVGGVSVTRGFPNETIAIPAAGPATGTVYTEHSSDAGDYLVGIMAEVRLPRGLSVEADGIYRPSNFKAFSSSVQSNPASSSPSNTVLTQQFPLLLNYMHDVAQP